MHRNIFIIDYISAWNACLKLPLLEHDTNARYEYIVEITFFWCCVFDAER